MTDLEMAQEVLDRILQLDKERSEPLRQLDPDDLGVRQFKLGDYYFQVTKAVPRFFTLSEPFGAIKKVIVQQHASFNYYETSGYPFFLNMENTPPAPKWLIQRDRCQALLTFLRMEMVLSDLAGVRGPILSVEGSITA